jgi:DEAD/DEAH box helicase domain-containing protein
MDMFSMFAEKEEDKKEEQIAIFDLETQRSADEVGWDNIDLMYMSVGVVHIYPEDKVLTFFEDDAEEMIDLLASKDRIVSYNGLHFDNRVLSYYASIDMWDLPHTDMMLDINDALGRERSLSLDNVSKATLGGKGKSADPLSVFGWYLNGEFDKIAKYCADDVDITTGVFNYGRVHGEIYFTNRNDKRISTPINWTIRKGEK